MEFEQILTNILLGILVVGAPMIIATGVGAIRLFSRWVDEQVLQLESKIIVNAYEYLRQRTYDAIHTAAQEFVGNEEKKQYVTQQLRIVAAEIEGKFGVVIPNDDIDALIESIYHQIKEELKG
jgi:methylase of polypeptide subunit release factors